MCGDILPLEKFLYCQRALLRGSLFSPWPSHSPKGGGVVFGVGGIVERVRVPFRLGRDLHLALVFGSRLTFPRPCQHTCLGSGPATGDQYTVS